MSKREVLERGMNRVICPECDISYTLNNPYKKPVKEGICNKCGGVLVRRSSDEEEILRKRYNFFSKATYPVIHYFSKKKKLIVVDSSQPNENIITIINSL